MVDILPEHRGVALEAVHKRIQMPEIPARYGALLEDIGAIGAQLTTSHSVDYRKAWAQYFTSPQVARFMASLLVVDAGQSRARVLDPGAGAGILGVSATLRLLAAGIEKVHLVAIETEPAVLEELHRALRTVASVLGHRFSYEIYSNDFLSFHPPGFMSPRLPAFDYVISNPPYFKLSPRSACGGDAPNIYARFMEVAASLLRSNGQMVFIVPRSYASGYYFRRFRLRFHAQMSIERVHVFGSRRAAFKAQDVLQENIIVRYRKATSGPSDVLITSSEGVHDLGSPKAVAVARSLVLPPSDPLGILRLPTSRRDVEILSMCAQWTGSLRTYGLDISTGPVVPFRAARYLLTSGDDGSGLPLLWMQHIQRGRVQWPIGRGFRKEEYIHRDAPRRLLVPNGTYVLLRRFSAKEDASRLTAAVLPRGQLRCEFFGIENHVNYIHRPGHGLSMEEARGLAALLNSRLMDGYFRIVSGNTQVNAAEIRALPLPSMEAIREIGRGSQRDADVAVDSLLRGVVDG